MLKTPFLIADLLVEEADGSDGLAIHSNVNSDSFGSALSVSGDFNKDGIDDLLIGAPDAPNGGAVYVVFGTSGQMAELDPATLDGTNGFKITGLGGSREFGVTVDNAGDVNGDGTDDIIVGMLSGGLSDRRTAFVLFGTQDEQLPVIDLAALELSSGFAIQSPGGTGQQGVHVAGLGDINLDGFDDVAISPASGGSGYVVFGRVASASVIDLATATANEVLKVSGYATNLMVSISGLGDVNGDGRDDLAIWASLPGSSLTGDTGCEIRILHGSAQSFGEELNATEIDSARGARLSGERSQLGSCTTRVGSVTAAGDFNGDEIGDFIVGVPDRYVDNLPSVGSAFVVFGRQGGLGTNLSIDQLDGSNGFTIVGTSQFSYLGKAVAGTGDLNADGLDDVVVGSPDSAVDEATRAGKGYVIFGGESVPAVVSTEQLTGLNGFEIRGAVAEDWTGTALAGGGDVDGDGIDDLILGAPRRRLGNPEDHGAGRVYVIRGRDFVGELPRLSIGAAVTAEATDRFRFELSDASHYPTLAISIAAGKESVVEVTNPTEAITGDFNGDGLVDFAVVQPSGLDTSAPNGVVAVMLNNGDETFRPTPFNSILRNSDNLQSVDMDNDGDLDLATLHRMEGSISVLRNRGDGTFSNALTFSVGEFPTVLRFADMDGDSLPEAIVNNPLMDKSIAVLKNLGSGFFGASSNTPSDNTPSTFAFEDVDADGDLDVVVANSGNGQGISFRNSITVLQNDGSGGLTKASELITGEDGLVSANPSYLAIGDLDGDGRQDLVVIESDSSSSPRGAAWVSLGNGDGTFREARPLNVRPAPQQVYIQDLNGDQRPDLLINHDDDTFASWINTGEGSFQRRVELVGTPGAAFSRVADFDNDGDFDVLRVILGNEGSVLSGIERVPGQLAVFRNTGNGQIAGGASWRVGPRPVGITYGDFDRDGDTDIAVTNSGTSQGSAIGAANSVSVLWNDGTGLFPTRSDFGANRGPGAVVSADFNGDGFLDLATINTAEESVSILLQDKTGQFLAPLTYGSVGDGVAIDVGDVDHDGNVDLLVLSSRRLSVLLNSGNAIFANLQLELPPRGTLQRASSGTDVQIIDVDRDGNLDAVLGLVASSSGRSVSILFGNGDGTFGETVDVPVAGQQVAAMDYDGDGRIDIAGIDSSLGRTTLGLSFGLPGRQFSSIVTRVLTTDATSVNSSDIDLDGDIDLIITEGAKAVLGSGKGGLHVLLNDGTGNFADPLVVPTGIQPSQAIVTDLTGDGLPDVATVNFNSNDVTAYENVSIGVTDLHFPVALSHALDRDVTFSFRTAPVTAAAMFDFQSRTDTVVIPAGQTAAVVSIQVDNDRFDEVTELFRATLFDPINATIVDAVGEGRIIDDDAFLHLLPDVSTLPASGGTIEVTIVREDRGNLSMPLSVTLNSTSSAFASLPTSIVIPSDADRFRVTLSLASTDPAIIELTATASGFDATTADVVVTDNTPHPWQNALEPFDVNGDGSTSPLDALIIVNFLNEHGAQTLGLPSNDHRPPPYLDPSGDGVVAPIDVLLIINFLNNPSALEGEGSPVVRSFQALDVASVLRSKIRSRLLDIALADFWFD